MPLYEYICNNLECEKEYFSVLTSYEENGQRCPDCSYLTEERKHFYQFDFRM